MACSASLQFVNKSLFNFRSCHLMNSNDCQCFLMSLILTCVTTAWYFLFKLPIILCLFEFVHFIIIIYKLIFPNVFNYHNTNWEKETCFSTTISNIVDYKLKIGSCAYLKWVVMTHDPYWHLTLDLAINP